MKTYSLSLFICLILISFSFFFFFFSPSPSFADNAKPLTGEVSDPFVEAQEKLMHAKGSYKTIKQQEDAIQNMRRATRLTLKAAQLRAKAEKLQNRADSLVTKANQQALSRGLYITNPMAPVMMQPPPGVNTTETAKAPSILPVPGQPINIIVPKQEEVSYGQEEAAPPVPSGF